MLDNLAKNASVATADDQNLLWIGVGVHGQVRDHLLVRELVPLGALDDIVQDQHLAIVGGLEDENILVLALLVVEHLIDLEGHGLACGEGRWSGQSLLGGASRCEGTPVAEYGSLTRPHVGDFAEPSI